MSDLPEKSSGRIARFGVFELDLAAGELRKSGAKLRLQEQPFQVLALLLERAGDVVTREELRQKLWPADTFVDSWDFTGDAKLAAFGYALGQAAASQPAEIKWLPGDEFEKAQKKLTSTDIDGAALFAGHPELQPIYIEPIVYPPLARQVRLTGATKIKVTVAADGSVGMADAVTSHPLLLQATLDAVRKWQFQPGGRREFELNL